MTRQRRVLGCLVLVTLLACVATVFLAYYGRIWTAMPRPSLIEQIRSWMGL